MGNRFDLLFKTLLFNDHIIEDYTLFSSELHTVIKRIFSRPSMYLRINSNRSLMARCLTGSPASGERSLMHVLHRQRIHLEDPDSMREFVVYNLISA